MGKVNASWHRANPMPKNPTIGQRMEWHLAHVGACTCRPIPPGILDEIKRRGMVLPSGPMGIDRHPTAQHEPLPGDDQSGEAA